MKSIHYPFTAKKISAEKMNEAKRVVVFAISIAVAYCIDRSIGFSYFGIAGILDGYAIGYLVADAHGLI